MWAFSLSAESNLQKKLATLLALRHVQHRQPPGTPAAMHDLMSYTVNDQAVQLRTSARANSPAFAKRPIRNTPSQNTANPATIKQSLTVQPMASRQISRRTQRNTALAVRQP